MAKKHKPVTLSPPRNPLFFHPLMKKGGRHEKSNKAKRRQSKAKIRKEWYQAIIAEIDVIA